MKGCEMRPNKRDELVRKALEIFYRDGFNATGMDRLVVETGVSKTSMYKHFRTKDDLILAALRLRDENFRNWLFRECEHGADTPEGQMLAMFDVLADWFAQDGFRGCMFIKASAEFQDKAHPINAQAAEHKRLLLGWLTGLAQQAGFAAPEQLAMQLLLLKEGAIVAAAMLGADGPAREAKDAARLLLDNAPRSG
ncbi:TetR/AcrR family transcriptional regulator [Ruegeria jejuensis]|uniref:TetR/AcrR family transcriptional regulator n=1 Tax=Ruegeria jejuensis TaxID=3233338 RepID=UPI00355C8AB6